MFLHTCVLRLKQKWSKTIPQKIIEKLPTYNIKRHRREKWRGMGFENKYFYSAEQIVCLFLICGNKHVMIGKTNSNLLNVSAELIKAAATSSPAKTDILLMTWASAAYASYGMYLEAVKTLQLNIHFTDVRTGKIRSVTVIPESIRSCSVKTREMKAKPERTSILLSRFCENSWWCNPGDPVQTSPGLPGPDAHRAHRPLFFKRPICPLQGAAGHLI